MLTDSFQFITAVIGVLCTVAGGLFGAGAMWKGLKNRIEATEKNASEALRIVSEVSHKLPELMLRLGHVIDDVEGMTTRIMETERMDRKMFKKLDSLDTAVRVQAQAMRHIGAAVGVPAGVFDDITTPLDR